MCVCIWRHQLFSCDTPQVGSNAVIWCLWANGNIAWHASSKLSVPHSLVGWIPIEWQNDPVVIYHHYQVLLQCSVESVYPSADSFQLVSEQTEIEHGHWGRKKESKELGRTEEEEGAKLLIVAEGLNGKEKVGWFLWGTQRWNAVQCGCQG